MLEIFNPEQVAQMENPPTDAESGKTILSSVDLIPETWLNTLLSMRNAGYRFRVTGAA